MTRSEFAAKLKATYPVYKDMPDDELVTRTLAQYPVYANQIDDATPPTPPSSAAPPEQRVATPTLARTGLSGAEVKRRAAADQPQMTDAELQRFGTGNYTEPTTGETAISSATHFAGRAVSDVGALATIPLDTAYEQLTAAPVRRAYHSFKDAPAGQGIAKTIINAWQAASAPELPATKGLAAGTSAAANWIDKKAGVRPNAILDNPQAVAETAADVGTALVGGKKLTAPTKAEQIIAFYEPKLAAAATDAERAAIGAEMRRAVSGVADAAPVSPGAPIVASPATTAVARSRPDVEAPHVANLGV